MDWMTRLHAWAVERPALRVFTVLARVLLALAFVPSGLAKILDQPFTALPVTDPVGYFFAGFFSAHGYYRFIGVAQWVAGALLLVPSTATLGAVVNLPIVVNIFAITVAIGPAFGGTRFIAGAMVVANLYLLCWDWDRWKGILPGSGPGSARHGDVTTACGLLIAAGAGLSGVTGAHLARLHHDTFGRPAALIATGVVLGTAMLLRAYRRANR